MCHCFCFFFQCFRVSAAENIRKANKTINMIFKLSHEGGVAPGDRLKSWV